jgi:hypothetical protein
MIPQRQSRTFGKSGSKVPFQRGITKQHRLKLSEFGFRDCGIQDSINPPNVEFMIS